MRKLQIFKLGRIIILIAAVCAVTCSKRQNIWHDEMFALLQLSNERLTEIVTKSKKARSKASVIAVLQDSKNAISNIGTDFQNLVKKYPEINAQKPAIEREFSSLYSGLRQNLHEFLNFLSVWQEQYANDREFLRTMKELRQEATRIERITTPPERNN
jgi:prophage DNA circulation protein